MTKEVKIGNIVVPHGLFLAPMAGMTDSAFRKIARMNGAEYCTSEMISALALCYGDRKTASLAVIKDFDTPLAIQLFGHDPESMTKAAKMIAAGEFEGCSFEARPAAIDINMGCPVKKIAGSGDGSALMNSPKTAKEIVSKVKEALLPYNMPVTVKIRSGWDKSHINAPEFAAMMAEAGADAIYVHARTKDQLYAPPIDPDVIRAVRESVPKDIPVIGNGDIRSADDAINMMNETGCDGVMIGREALGNPWIFREITCKTENRIFLPVTKKERIETALSMIKDMALEYGEERAMREARGRAAYFIKDMRGAASAREKLNHAETYRDFEDILKHISNSNLGD